MIGVWNRTSADNQSTLGAIEHQYVPDLGVGSLESMTVPLAYSRQLPGESEIRSATGDTSQVTLRNTVVTLLCLR